MTTDQKILLWLNNALSSPLADFIFILLSDRWLFSFPLLLLIIIFSSKFIEKNAFRPFLFGLIFSVIVADQLGGLLKELIAAPRPCHDFYEFAKEGTKELLESCNSKKGMPSNHAFNFAAAATFISLRTKCNFLRFVLCVICILVAISRVYLAKHYPSQVLVGLSLGLALGYVVHIALAKFRFFRLPTNT